MVSSEFGSHTKNQQGRGPRPLTLLVVFVGGGFKKGYAQETSDPTGSEPDNDPLTGENMAATVYRYLVISSDKRLMAADNRPSISFVRPHRAGIARVVSVSQKSGLLTRKRCFLTCHCLLALNGIIEKDGDIDHFKISAKKGEEYDVKEWARRLRLPPDTVLTILK